MPRGKQRRYRFELHRGSTHKFIDATTEPSALVLVEGKIGTNGRTRTKATRTLSEAEVRLVILASGRLRREGWLAVKVLAAKAKTKAKTTAKAKASSPKRAARR